MNFQLLRAGPPHPHIAQRPTVMQNDKSGITSLKSSREGKIKQFLSSARERSERSDRTILSFDVNR